MSALLLGVAAVLLAAGATMIVRGMAGRAMVRQELSTQKIVFPDRDDLPADLARYARAHVRTGEQARAFADLIAAHVAQATGGRTYAEINDEWHAGGRNDERLAGLRETAFTGQAMRSALLGAYQAWQVTTLVIGLGAILAPIGLAFVAIAVTWA